MEPLLDYYEEVTDDEDYKENNEVISIESNSSAADSMPDEDFEVADPLKFDASLMKISNGLKHAAEGFEELRQMLPSVPVTELPKLIEETPLPYLTPLSKEMVQALQSVGEVRMVDLALHEEHSKGASQVSLMLKYGVTRNRLHKVLTGISRPGGSQYQHTCLNMLASKIKPCMCKYTNTTMLRVESKTQAVASYIIIHSCSTYNPKSHSLNMIDNV